MENNMSNLSKKWPCNQCPKLQEADYVTHDFAALAFWQGIKARVNACVFDPRYAAPDQSAKCPYKKYFGKPFPMVRVSCDFCNKVLLEFPMDEQQQHISIDMNGTYICNECLKNPNNEMYKELAIDKKIITENEVKELKRYVKR